MLNTTIAQLYKEKHSMVKKAEKVFGVKAGPARQGSVFDKIREENPYLKGKYE